MSRSVVLAMTITVSTLAGCRRSTGEMVPIGLPLPGSASTHPGSTRIPTTWTLTPVAQHRQYRLAQHASLTAAENENMLQRFQDSLKAVVGFSLNIQSSASATSFGIEITSVSRENTYLPEQQPVLVAGHITGETIFLDEINQAKPSPLLDCTDLRLSYVPAVEQVVLIPPTSLHVGMKWRDSTTLSACAGAIPASFSLVRQYQVISGDDQNGKPKILIQHEDHTTMRGSGSEEQHRVQIEGTGIGTMRSTLDGVTGALLQSKGNRSMTFTVTASGRSVTFTQQTAEELTLLR